MSLTPEQIEGYNTLKAEAAKRGKTLQEFLDTDIRRILEKAWDIQKRTGKSVPLDQLVKELNENEEA